jgi:hypothetical protein
MKFKVSPSVRAAAVPTGTGFGAFDGLKRHCDDFQLVPGKHSKKKQVLRCYRFKKGRGKPECDFRLVDGGRSPYLVRNGPCSTSQAPYRKKAKSSRRRRAR